MKLYHDIKKMIDKLKWKCRHTMFSPENIIPYLKTGRMIKVTHENQEFDWGIVVTFKKTTEQPNFRGPRPKPGDKSINVILMIDILLHVEDGETIVDGKYQWKPCPKDKTGVMEVVSVPVKSVLEISSVRVHLPDDLRPVDARTSVLKLLKQVKLRFKNEGLPLLDPIADMKISDPKFLKSYDEYKKLEERLNNIPIANDSNITEKYDIMLKKIEVRKAMRLAREELSRASSILQLEELKNRKKVLRKLGFCDESDVIQLKGRIACELSTADELLLTEMIFNGIFDKLSPEMSTSLLSCFVCDEKSQKKIQRAEELADALRNMQHIARNIAKISNECSLNLKEDEYVEKFKPSLMDVVFAWCNGTSFIDLCNMTDVFEGSIIRTIRRLEELLRQLCQAAKSIGNAELEQKFSEGIRLIKRDIVFAASLYL